ncbi:dipeptide ABC transporter ATP-binding protein [Brevibacillus nitrificans]|uniref:Dipeptide ABC transporter ATP-binding protein n=1 Tax=Brevibacillus nitrificans TaxID=651560 RepID=A0A3M8D711_9BACL|nr:dipeptide ABC transporter ATP-binding protein [Brevibacillus nitrificans]RNB83187.1 dipeptide ABC transporter ATP-binding protein [Brevibacillus nitrificans]
MEELLDVRDLTVDFMTKTGLLTAINEVSFHIKKGEIVCLVGESGSGKTITSLSIMRLIEHANGQIADGTIRFAQQDIAQMQQEEIRKIRGKKIAMIFQEPMTALDPVFTIGFQIMEVILRHEPVSKEDARKRAVYLLQRVGIPEPKIRMNQYPHELSGGMRQRAMIAIALACNPELLIADEPTTALDVTIQSQILDLLRELKDEFQMSILLITHDLGVAAEMADRIIVMYTGRVVEQATVHQLFERPYHPYTQGLLQSIPSIDVERGSRLHSIKGTIPSLTNLPSGCRFQPRCPHATLHCESHEPMLAELDGRQVACWHAKEIAERDKDVLLFQAKTARGDTQRAEAGTQEDPNRNVLIDVQDLKKYFPIKKGILNRVTGQIKAVDGVTFQIFQGETFGLVGESGCGKTTLGRTLLRLQQATSGRVLFEDRDLFQMNGKEMREARREMQIIFQDPYGSLNPRWTIGDIIEEPLRAHGSLQGQDLKYRVQELLEWVGLDPAWYKRYPHEFSGGQRQRIGIARAIALQPKFIVGDEAVSALDVSVQSQVINLLCDLQSKLGLTYLFIAHGLDVVRHISDRIGVMYLGKLVEVAPTDELFTHPTHPYTKALLSAIPVPNPEKRRSSIKLEGEIPSPANPPSGCRFRTRCPAATERCKSEIPELKEVGKGHWVSCHFAM